MGSEIVSTVERRRRWSLDEKVRIMSEALEPGASMAAVADRNGVCRSLLYTWLRLAREDRLPGLSLAPPPQAGTFVPVRIAPAASGVPERPAPSPAPSPPPDAKPAPSRRRAATIEITLANGRVMKVDEGIDATTLGRIVAALDDEAAQ